MNFTLSHSWTVYSDLAGPRSGTLSAANEYFERTSLNEFRSPNYDRIDIIREVAPKAAKRGVDVYTRDYNNADPHMPARARGEFPPRA
jgi:hypothetical protein